MRRLLMRILLPRLEKQDHDSFDLEQQMTPSSTCKTFSDDGANFPEPCYSMVSRSQVEAAGDSYLIPPHSRWWGNSDDAYKMPKLEKPIVQVGMLRVAAAASNNIKDMGSTTTASRPCSGNANAFTTAADESRLVRKVIDSSSMVLPTDHKKAKASVNTAHRMNTEWCSHDEQPPGRLSYVEMCRQSVQGQECTNSYQRQQLDDTLGSTGRLDSPAGSLSGESTHVKSISSLYSEKSAATLQQDGPPKTVNTNVSERTSFDQANFELPYPSIVDPINPAFSLNSLQLRGQRTGFISVVVVVNAVAVLIALLVHSGLWVLIFILFVKSKDCLYTILAAVGLLIRCIHTRLRPPAPISSKWILTLIPTYAESEEQVIRAIFSLRDNQVQPHKQVMVVMQDGNPQGIWKHFTRLVRTFRRPYVTSKFNKSTLQISAGFIEDVPIIVFEKLKNAGKKDSLILCHDLFNFPRKNAPLYTNLLREEIWTTILPTLTLGTDFHAFDMVFCTDADSTIERGSVAALANAVGRDKNAIAACGLVLVQMEKGREWSSWNLYQQYQYTFGQYVRRRAEGLFGKVTCLPGCITMIAVRPEMAGAIQLYAQPVTGWPILLHQVQYLGTDRRLTYSMLAQNKKLHTLFIPEAISKTGAPQSLQHYLSQRRRWGSNAYFNDFYYCFGSKMILITRLAAFVEIVRMTMVYYRLVNSALFLHGLVKHFELVKIIPLLVVSQLPTVWFAVCVCLLERPLQKRAHKLLLGFFINKLFAPAISVTVFTKVVLNLGSQVWGMTGAGKPTATTVPVGHLGEAERVTVLGEIVETLIGDPLAHIHTSVAAEEEKKEERAGQFDLVY